MEKSYVTFKQFKNLITSQPFFVWNTLEEIQDDSIDVDHQNFWSSTPEEAAEATYGEIAARTSEKFNKWLRNKLQSITETVILNGTKEERIEKTKEALKGKAIIISPVFEYKGAIAEPFAYDPVDRRAIYIKYSKKTKVTDLIKPYWDFQIIRHTSHIADIRLYLPEVKKYKKGEISLRGIDAVHATKGGKLPFQPNAKGKVTDTNILEFCKKPVLKHFAMPSFDEAMEKIEKARDAKLDKSKLFLDTEQLDHNRMWKELLAHIGFEYAEWNGRIISKKDIIQYFENGDKELFNSEVHDAIKGINKATVYNQDIREIERIRESKKVIWYDFEGYSLPFAPLDNIAPHQQVVFQVSVIETVDNEETRCENVVLDPKTLTADDLAVIIDSVYSEGAEAYVVYNKGYEIPRMKEIVNLLQIEGNPKAGELLNKLNDIEVKTVDLMNVFKISSKNTLPPILLHDQHAKASIKNVEKHITKNEIKVPRPIFPYAQLEVQNGGMAMEAGIQRAIGLIGDKEWEQKIEALKKYCENDVRAMIMVYDFANMIMDKHGTN